MPDFTKFVLTPAGLGDASLAIAASRAGAVGVYNAELDIDPGVTWTAMGRLAQHAHGAYGIKLDAIDEACGDALRTQASCGMSWLLVDAALIAEHASLLGALRLAGTRVLAEVRTSKALGPALETQIDGILVKGNEAGGFVGEDASFILLQKWLGRTRLPLYLRGGLTPHVAAACSAVGIAGGVLDSQLLLLDEVRLPESMRTLIGNLAGSETVAVGHGEHGEYFRLLVRPGHVAARQFVLDGDDLHWPELRARVVGQVQWNDTAKALLPIGHDVAFAGPWRKRYGNLGAVLKAIDLAVADHPRLAASHPPFTEGAPLARALGLRYPIVQGPMTRVSDTAEFALAVAAGGALPMVAFAMLKGQALEDLLTRTSALLLDRPWGIGLLGFAPQSLLDEQLAIAIRFKPAYAIIAGGRPDQAVQLEGVGVPTFLHVPAAGLIAGFLQEGARRFIFEGRECGGHIGPLSSFVLWSTMVDRLLLEVAPAKVKAEEVQLLFAGGIHDAVSSAMLQVLVAPLVAAGAKVGILMGSAYLFTKEIVDTGSIVEQFQQEVIECERTVNLESGPGHASRCAYTPFARDFFQQRVQLKQQAVPSDESRRILDDLILGRLRIASKGSKREGLNAPLQRLAATQQHEEGMYMLGQVATLRDSVTSIAALHHEVTDAAAALLLPQLERHEFASRPAASEPADIAVIGVAAVLPKANTARAYWENILAKVDAITEIPSHRWDWRLYFDADRQAKDKIYSKWGGFLDDLPFDPMKYGMPPKSIESVDPMQLMGLEVAHRTLVDAGYHERAFDREKASVIIGASGGAGDYGLQYGLRSELPRFSGDLPGEVAQRLPEWTEDSFAGILPNVVAGRIANRLNFGGMNAAVDAACASSLAAVYQGVCELAAGRSDFVIAGGVDTVQGPFGYLCFSKTQALSPRGRCSTFDTNGDGIVISEGIAMVALKRLADAVRDGDRVYAVIKGVGASSDGNAKGLTAPLPAGQLRAMRRAYAMAGFGPSTVGLFEAHGTGTVAGDTAELESTTRLMKEEGAKPQQAVIGSVKTNIGHTKACAGVAGLIKAVLALHHQVLPPHRNVVTPNRVLADPDAPLYLVDEATPWIAPGDVPRRAATSAFGFGGTNFHVVLEEHTDEYREWLRPTASDTWPAELMVWSDIDVASLQARLETLRGQLVGLETLALRDLAASLAARWRPRGHAVTIVARSVEDLSSKLDATLAFLRGDVKALPPGICHGTATQPAGKVAVLFPGQGSQYAGMAREAALHFGAVAETLTQADAVLRDAFGTRFGAGTRLSQFILPRGAYDDLSKDKARHRLTQTDVAQPALGAVEVGLFRLMQSLGLAPAMFAGHSYGEFVALFAAGAIDFDALMNLSAARGRFIVDAASSQGAELGTMAAVNAPRQVVEEAIADIDGVVIANHNAPLQSIISGSRKALEASAAKLAQVGVEAVEIPVAAAFHSSLVQPAQRALSAMIDATPWAALRVPVYSNTTARVHSDDVQQVKRQMAEHLVRPVEWVAQVEAMYRDGARVFVEVGPKSVLSRLTSRILEGQPHTVVALDDGSGLSGLLSGIGQLLCAGIGLELPMLFARRDCRVGDPAIASALVRTEPIPKHAWMLNGSGARRAADPVRQIGVTLEQAQAHTEARVQPAVAVTPPPGRTVTPIAPATTAARPERVAYAPVSVVPPHVLKRGRPMDERRMAPGMADSSVMSDYFATMRHFLEAQERVMTAFLGEPSPARPVLRSPVRPLPMALPSVAQVAAPVAQVVAAAPATTPVVAKPPDPPAPRAAAPAQAPVARVSEPPAAAKGAGDTLTRDKLVDMLLGIIEEKTGYPRDMVGLDQNLEADLGIDSIKRIEVVGAMLQMLSVSHREALTESRSKLNTQASLNGMLDLIAQAKTEGAVAVPFELAGAGSQADAFVSHPPRLVIRPHAEVLGDSVGRHLSPGQFVITRDRLGVAQALATLLGERGCQVVMIESDALATEASLIDFCRGLQPGPLAGVVHLAALGTPALAESHGPAEWRDALHKHEKSLFLLLRELNNRLAAGAHTLAASDLGGLFGRSGTATPGLRLISGTVGALKSYREERPDVRVKAVDLDPRRTAIELATTVLAELELDGGRQEVGYPSGVRTVFRTVAADLVVDPARELGLTNLVVLATGGSRGITAEALRELACPGNVLVLTGRSVFVEVESNDTSRLPDADALRKHHVALVRAGTLKLTPGDIQRRVQAVLDQREMRANVKDFRATGAVVEYCAVDVTDDAAVRKLIADITQRHGRVDGVVHGAGVIEDKRLADKHSDSWSRVVDTKVIGLLALQKHIDPATLKFFTVFSSVAGRYGNSGQSDYAAANELMNRLCLQLQVRWGDHVAVNALCWGPWGATRFGAGMVTAATEAKFAEKGVRLVSAQLGRRLFRQELGRAVGSAVEVVCGEAPWESREAELGAIRPMVPAPQAPTLGPLLGNGAATSLPTGERIVQVRLDPTRHLYLPEHALDGKFVLPAAAALELMAEAAGALWPGWCVVEVREHRLLKGVDLDGYGRDLHVFISPPPYGSSEGFEVNASLRSDLGNGRSMAHYRCVIRLEQGLRLAEPARRAIHDDQSLTVAKAYGEWLFHGPRFQVIEHIEGLSPAGSGARVRSTHPVQWMAQENSSPMGWLFDPALLDAAAQMAWLWARAYRGESALPTRFGRVVRYRDHLPPRLHMEYECTPTTDPTLVRGNVVFFDDGGEPVLMIEELDSVASAALNRLGGTSRSAEGAAA
jgi:acyl transferase domain-containing protein/NAD(P)-dependent dehydrogenase (short-subunit alcohol dehydrogenase family)/NAD(P)H-dependent flavin oxidoreductase YrpB (nitropropane dioxygenase family)